MFIGLRIRTHTHTMPKSSTTYLNTIKALPPEDRFAYWITERLKILRKKQAGLTTLTQDPILRHYSFCNVFRQDDRVSVWLNNMWYADNGKNIVATLPVERALWFAAFARCLNQPSSLGVLAPYMHTDALTLNHTIALLDNLKANGIMVRNSAYIVSTCGLKEPFNHYICNRVLFPFRHSGITAVASLAQVHTEICKHHGFQSFLAAQLLADLKYIHPAFKSAPDFMDFVAIGPGSKRGMNRLLGRQHNSALAPAAFAEVFPLAYKIATKTVKQLGYPNITAQDVQNCLCEFDKYERTLHNQGTPRRKYAPQTFYTAVG